MPTKRRTPQKLVCLSQPKYEKLMQAKEAYEADQGKKTDWGGFLLFLGLAYKENSSKVTLSATGRG